MKRCTKCRTNKINFSGFLLYFYEGEIVRGHILWKYASNEVLVEQHICKNGHTSKKFPINLPVERGMKEKMPKKGKIGGFQLIPIQGEIIGDELKVNWDNSLGKILILSKNDENWGKK